ncbi:MAG TPA: PAS domain-containing protein [Candidatus Avamphibacillus intestinigallinarum]|nr:PAS domain-containing protein [Candidatus Avamphibacillus intestinigallinarum]
MKDYLHKYDLIHQNQIIRSTIERLGVGVSITDPNQEDNPIIYVNEGFTKITGYEPEEVLGLNARFLQGDNPDPIKFYEIEDGVSENKPVRIRLKNFKKDGTPFWNFLNIFPVTIEELNQSFFIAIQNDITEDVEKEMELKAYVEDVRSLSTPILPITDSISVLPLIGRVTEDRLTTLMDSISAHILKNQSDYLIIDLSSIGNVTEGIYETIRSLDQLLSIMGSCLILTGITPNLAIGFNQAMLDFNKFHTYNDVKSALAQLTT